MNRGRMEAESPRSVWPADLPVARVRVARPTDHLEKVVRFYRDGLGLTVLSSFEGHAGYSGVMLGLPDEGYHLEFTQHEKGSPGPAPSRVKGAKGHPNSGCSGVRDHPLSVLVRARPGKSIRLAVTLAVRL